MLKVSSCFLIVYGRRAVYDRRSRVLPRAAFRGVSEVEKMILEFISDWMKIGPSSLTFSFVFHSKVFSRLADFAFVIEVSGYQHGDLPFYPKRLSIAPVRAGSCHSITFNADFLLHHDERALSTYRFATT